MDVTYVGIGDLTTPGTLQEAFTAWSTYVELFAASMVGPYGPWFQLSNDAAATWSWQGGAPAVSLAPIGCHFIQDVELTGNGYLFHAARFILEKTHTSPVGYSRLQDEAFYDNPFVHPRQNKTFIEDPVFLVSGPGHNVFGHWLLDFIPRIEIAKRLLGHSFSHMTIVLPSDTPGWVAAMLQTCCDLDVNRLRYYDSASTMLHCRSVCIPDIGHDGNYAFHAIIPTIYQSLANRYAGVSSKAPKRICLSRRNFSAGRAFAQREAFESLAIARGFDVVTPEEHSFAEQIALFQSADCIIGEHGSGLHASVFAKPGTVIGSVGWNWIQPAICSRFEQTLVTMNRTPNLEPQPGQPQWFTAETADLVGLLDQVERCAERQSAPS